MHALVVSDNHGDQEILAAIIAKWQGKVDLLVHCGDSELAPTSPVMRPFLAVKGNNDFNLQYPLIQVNTTNHQRLLVTHGHRYQVNYSLTPLMLKGEEQAADIVCYGHTHQLAVTVERGMLLINPGSISLPRGQYAYLGGTCAVVEATPEHFVVDYYDRTFSPVTDLHFEFKR